MDSNNYAGKLKTSLTWWLGKKRSFSINDEYKLELLFVDKINNSAKIKITNLKTGEILNTDNTSFSEVYNGQD